MSGVYTNRQPGRYFHRPTFTRTSAADPAWRVALLRVGRYVVGIGVVYGRRQAAFQWAGVR